MEYKIVMPDRIFNIIFNEDEVIGFQVMDYLLGVVGKQFEQYQDQMAKNRGIEIMSQW